MAQDWSAKAPTEVVERRWSVPLTPDDRISTVAAIGTGVTVDSTDDDRGDALVVLSAGSAGEEATVTVTVTTAEGLTLVETFLIAIRATTEAFGVTATDVIAFALRPIVGIGETADADEAAVGLEMLNGMLAEWRIDGMDVGLAAPLVSTDTLPCRDEFIDPIRWNLRVRLADEFGYQLPASTVMLAERGKALVANPLLKLRPLTFETPRARRYMTGIDDV